MTPTPLSRPPLRARPVRHGHAVHSVVRAGPRAATQKLAAHLVDNGCDGLVLNGTTGESPTTSDKEKTALVRAVVEAVGDRAAVVAGVGSASTAHTVALAREAERAGADGLLVVTPYYSRPPQSAVEAHFRTVADATALPVMLYDIPVRTGTRIEVDDDAAARGARADRGGEGLCVRPAGLDQGHRPYVAGVLLRRDELNLALYALGGAGYVSTVANVAPRAVRAVLDAFDEPAP